LETEAATEALLQRINDDGRIYLTQTRVDGRFAIRVQVGSFDCTREDVMLIATTLRELLASCSFASSASP
jgi:aromatic-L-amino-acid decarboxylase